MFCSCYHRSQKRNLLLVRSSVCCLRLARASSKITAASGRISSRFVRSTPCFLYDKERQSRQELKACYRNLAAGRSLDPVLGREPALALDSLLHSNH